MSPRFGAIVVGALIVAGMPVSGMPPTVVEGAASVRQRPGAEELRVLDRLEADIQAIRAAGMSYTASYEVRRDQQFSPSKEGRSVRRELDRPLIERGEQSVWERADVTRVEERVTHWTGSDQGPERSPGAQRYWADARMRIVLGPDGKGQTVDPSLTSRQAHQGNTPCLTPSHTLDAYFARVSAYERTSDMYPSESTVVEWSVGDVVGDAFKGLAGQGSVIVSRELRSTKFSQAGRPMRDVIVWRFDPAMGGLPSEVKRVSNADRSVVHVVVDRWVEHPLGDRRVAFPVEFRRDDYRLEPSGKWVPMISRRISVDPSSLKFGPAVDAAMLARPSLADDVLQVAGAPRQVSAADAARDAAIAARVRATAYPTEGTASPLRVYILALLSLAAMLVGAAAVIRWRERSARSA